MKKLVAFAFLLLFTTSVNSQTTGPALDYGARVNIEPGYETSLDLSYLQDPNTYGFKLPLPRPGFAYPVWSPKGDRIFFTDHFHIYSVPVTGGKPRLEYDGNLLYPYNGRRYVLNQIIFPLAGISPDGKKLYFKQTLIGEGSGTPITIKEEFDKDGKLTGWGYSIGEGDPVLQCLDLETGKATVLAHDVWEGSLSRSGRYLEYLTWKTKTVHVLDLETGEDRSLSIFAHSARFTDLDQNLLYLAPTDSTRKFFKIPVRGGEPQEVTVLSANTEKVTYPVDLDCTPEGDWAIYSCFTDEIYKGGLFTKYVQKVNVSNIKTGQTMEVVPFSKVKDVYWPRFSPDGKKICYITQDFENSSSDQFALYIKDVSFLTGKTDGPVSVADALPQDFAFTANYPNPFNPSTHIAFIIPAAGAVQLYGVRCNRAQGAGHGFLQPVSGYARDGLGWPGRVGSGGIFRNVYRPAENGEFYRVAPDDADEVAILFIRHAKAARKGGLFRFS